MSKKQKGPSTIKSCYKCTDLKTVTGFCQLHHDCKIGMFKGISTPHQTFPDTPDNCFYLLKRKGTKL